ncbi:hypothetical protein TNIN_454391 [Trichonephila inaurata madagascariensis]|uniref:Uncharacterized protein n=1 Tax=Trichonephila inaurata madagascariensis TaxID=2747483 RepID=A0A8X6M8Z7_9ARAC|nr:hypothetical protein TNIN_454391 [Trichonephila inaurata madagascariensis]
MENTVGEQVNCAIIRKGCRRDETVKTSKSCYNLRPRRGAKVESRTSSEKRTQQGGPVRSRGNREQYNPYAEKQRNSGGWSTRSRRGQQQHCQERAGGRKVKNPSSLKY